MYSFYEFYGRFMEFIVEKKSGKARLGVLKTDHGIFETPVFMPVGTRAAVKTLTPQNLIEMNAGIILANTYHLMLRPGREIIKAAGGLHNFMNWPRPILTDSGGFQVFSLSSLNKISDEGVTFKSHIDGKEYFLGPRESMAVQRDLGADIVMAFDECPPYPCSYDKAAESLERTLKWEKICLEEGLQSHQNLFAIVQGSNYGDLRRASAQALRELPFAGYALGGLSVGEPAELMYEMIEATEDSLPFEKPRYLMGVGTPRNIIEAVIRGVDMFDCVMPTRNARNGTAFTWSGKINIKAGKYARDFTPLDAKLDCYTSQFSKAYIRHLLNVDEITGLTLVTIQNLAFYLDFMFSLRQAIADDSLGEFYKDVCAIYPS